MKSYEKKKTKGVKRGQSKGKRRLKTKVKEGLQIEERGLQKVRKKAEIRAKKVAAKKGE